MVKKETETKDSKSKKTATKRRTTKKPVAKKEKKVVKPTEKEVEVMNGDPSVITPTDDFDKKDEQLMNEALDKVVEDVTVETVEKPIKEAETITKKITKKIHRYFGYIWNGQAIDY